MTQNERFSILFILVLCFFSNPRFAAAGTPELCGLEKEDLGKFVRVPSGFFIKNKKPMYPEEGKPTSKKVYSFEIQLHEVTNNQFQRFIIETGYVTDAEKSERLNNYDSGSAVFLPTEKRESRNGMTLDTVPSWELISGATWKSPLGPGSDIEGKEYYPVVHVSLRDTKAYAFWSKTRIPTETEWEYAASLGLIDSKNQMSGAYDREGKPVSNTWQGRFPSFNTGRDGFFSAAPIGCYQPSALGLFDMIGNVWEWTDTPYNSRMHIIKGGSFLCSQDFCRRFRPSARQFQEKDFSTNHLGFRVVRDIEDKAREP